MKIWPQKNLKNGNEHFNMERCALVTVVEIPKQIKEAGNHH